MKTKSNLLQLIEQARCSKPQAQSKIVNLFWDEIKGYINSLTKDEILAEELTINTFTKVLNKLSLYNSDFDFKTWIVSIAHNTTVDCFRKRSKGFDFYIEDSYSEIKDMEPSPEQVFIEKQDSEVLERMMSKLPKNYSYLMQLRYLEGKKLKEITKETDLSLANVKVSLMRAKKLLFEMQQKDSESDNLK
ncbi:RNA polymerase sigma factor [Apibacter adventoris]|uniref:RNA polymerase sigma factor n=1 Tax=Apibacter adventoris TaxID=1679466 RepID=UPI000CF66794|nr:sigma-70 family RNA polymerase sigma factor [Apibacter adventoris]PQL94808.1 RNA polymerase subunit sigma-24 [Apibacter adventoris]